MIGRLNLQLLPWVTRLADLTSDATHDAFLSTVQPRALAVVYFSASLLHSLIGRGDTRTMDCGDSLPMAQGVGAVGAG